MLRPDVDASALRSLPDIVSDVGPGLVPDGEPRLVATRLLEHTLLQLGRLWPDLACTILVQEPWMGTIRFKRLARLRGDAMRPFLDDPEGFLRERFGGGKFKINLHHGMHFVSTKNFRPSGPSRWAELPEVAEE